MSTRVFLLVSLAMLILLPMALAQNSSDSTILWPTFKGDYARTGFYDVYSFTNLRSVGMANYSLRWSTGAELCIASSPAIGDIDGDGAYEAVYSSCDGYVYSVDTVNGTIEWRYSTGGEFADPSLADLDGDGLSEVLVVGSRGTLYALKGDRSVLWSVVDRMFRGSPIVGDFDGDGSVEVAMGSSDGYLYVVGPRGSVEEELGLGSQPVDTPSAADIDNDDLPEIVAVSGPDLYVVDYSSGKYVDHVVGLEGLLVQPPVVTELYGTGRYYAVAVNRDGHLFVVDLLNGTIVQSVSLPVEDVAASPSIGDVNGDGAPEIVVGSMQGLLVLDTSLNILRWYKELKIYTSSPIIADIDLDGWNEVIVGMETGEIMVIDASAPEGFFAEVEWMYTTSGPIMGSAAVADIDGDHLPELLIGSRDYHMYCFDINTETINITSTTTITPTASQETTSKTSPAGINIPTTRPSHPPAINIPLVVAALVGSIIIIMVVYYLTR